jgi:hypothetical protein
MRPTARRFVLLLPLVLALPALAASPPVGAAASEEEGTLAADVKIEVRNEKGKVVTFVGEVPALEMDHKLAFEGEGSSHEVTLNIKRESASKLIVTVAYDRDAMPIIAPYTTDFKPKKREVLWAEKIALALTIKPKVVKPKDTSRDEDDQVKPDDSDDPMGKLEKKDPKKKKKS